MPNKQKPNFSLESLIPRIGNVPHFKGFSEQALKEIVFAGQMMNYEENAVPLWDLFDKEQK